MLTIRITKALFYLWNSFELFLLIFILLYVFFESYWLIICILLGVLGKLYNLQDLLLYHPNEPCESRFYVERPFVHDLSYETITIKTLDNINLHSYLLKQNNIASKQIPTIVYFHGNAGNIGQRLILGKYLYTICSCNVLMVEYRGYGLSEGVPSEQGFYLDAEAACSYLYSRNDIDKTRIVLYGQSIGGAVAIHTAFLAKLDYYALIIENTFTTLPDIGRELFSAIPFVNTLPEFCFKNQFRSLDKIKLINTIPCLFMSGSVDTLVPPRMMLKLFERSTSWYKRLVKIEHGDHNNTWSFPGYFQSINKFLNEIPNTRLTNQDSQVWIVS
jgi:abhydrolase domain-containing protein 13